MQGTAPARVTLVVDSQTYGGAEVYVAHLLEHLPDRVLRSLVATAPVPAELGRAAEAAGARVEAVPSVRHKADVPRLLALAAAIRRTRPDLVHVNQSTLTNDRHAVAVATLLRRPCVATLHLWASDVGGLQRRTLRAWYGRLSRMIAVSADVGERLTTDIGLPPATVAVIPNGVPFRPPVAAAAQREKLRIGAVGRLTRQKGFDVLVEAARRLAAAGCDVEVDIAGDGPDRAALEALADGAPVRLLGFSSDVTSFLATVDVFCLPSRWEGLPFALLEAMMMGLPSVVTPVGGVAEAVGPAAVVVPADDVDALTHALATLVSSPDERGRLGEAAHDRAAARYSVQAMVDRVVHVYDEALRGRVART